MSVPFDPQQGLIIVRAELWGPNGSGVLRLALDTGATGTVVNVGMLVALGYDPALVPERVQVTTGSGIEFAPRVILDRVIALGHERSGFFRYLVTRYRRAQALMVSWVSIFFVART